MSPGHVFPRALIAAFKSYRNLWDRAGLLNPGSITEPDPVDANLALNGIPDREWRTHFELRPIEAAAAGTYKWVHAVQACIGVGRCRSDAGGVMCPSYRATGDEKDSTRGRSRVFQDMVRGGRTVDDGWKSEDVREALDLCLACKACSNDCPTGVDMATYKSEFFSHYYEGKKRPMSHFSLGWLPRWLKITARFSPIVNAVMGSPLGKVVAASGGLTTKRAIPKFASRKMLRDALKGIGRDDGISVDIVLFVDSFTKGFRPEVAGAAVRVVQGTGRQVSCESDACCGLTWISPGQLATAKKIMAKTDAKLDDGTVAPIVVIEPSCAAALRKDAPELLGIEAAKRVSRRIQLRRGGQGMGGRRMATSSCAAVRHGPVPLPRILHLRRHRPAQSPGRPGGCPRKRSYRLLRRSRQLRFRSQPLRHVHESRRTGTRAGTGENTRQHPGAGRRLQLRNAGQTVRPGPQESSSG